MFDFDPDVGYKFIRITYYSIQTGSGRDDHKTVAETYYFNTAVEIKEKCTEVKQEELDKLDLGDIITYMNDSEDNYHHVIIRIGNKYTGTPFWFSSLPNIHDKG